MTTPYYHFTKGQLPISPLKIDYNKHKAKVQATENTANILPLLTEPPVTFAVVEKTQKEIKDEEEMKGTEPIEDKKPMLLDEFDKGGMNIKGIEDEKAAMKATENTNSRADSNTKQGVFAYFNRKKTNNGKEYTLKEFTISRTLLERRSPYCTRLLNENESVIVPLEIKVVPGVLSPQSVSKLIHWWYREEVLTFFLKPHTIKSEISNLIELARLMEHVSNLFLSSPFLAPICSGREQVLSLLTTPGS